MSKFKPGDKVRILPRLEGQCNQGPAYTDVMSLYVGKEFVIQEIRTTDGIIELEGVGYVWHEDWLELVNKPFTQEDLEIGMLVELDNGTIYDVEAAFLDNSRKGEEVVAIYEPTETGFERVWTKPESEPKLYTLELPKNTGMTRFYNLIGEEDYGFQNDHNSSLCKTHFTQEEIDNLPNQDLIKVLIKKEVVK